MITFICCSVDPVLSENLKNNITETIGNVPFEFIAFDNREAHIGMCEVYNNFAVDAKYDYMCFLHEDIKFLTNDWGNEIVSKLKEEDCGCIGFAGSIIKMAYPSGWHINNKCTRHHYRQYYKSINKKPSSKTHNPDKKDYSEVITLDGMALFVSKQAWNKCKFDEESLKGFHCYDIDFTINLTVSGYKNYVTNKLFIEHFSDGSFSEQWRTDTIKLHKKWEKHLPLYASSLSSTYLKRNIPKAYYNTVKNIIKYDLYTGIPSSEISNHIKKHPLNISSWKLVKLLSKYKSKYEG